MHLHILPDNDVVLNTYSNHSSINDGDSGLDLYIFDDIIITPGETKLIDLKIKCEAFPDSNRNQNIPFYLYPRSSISKTPLRLANSVGIIDKGYRGSIMAAIDNISNEPYHISSGSRLFQLCSPTLEPITFELVNQLSETDRGIGGFGSTGL